ncbi:hypothetical protein HHI36_022163 [Cryptolaemus montrouzieri]|uniref:Uncharacterized protein n=1 Tax=Cryptolaemus montrouzieri TaxID=559131 RepID=A0ABD2MZ88_9CUCU
MVRGRPVRTCTKSSILYSNARKKELRISNGTTPKKNQSITDFFQAVDISETGSKELNLQLSQPIRITRRNANRFLKSEIQESISIEDSKRADEDTINQVVPGEEEYMLFSTFIASYITCTKVLSCFISLHELMLTKIL